MKNDQESTEFNETKPVNYSHNFSKLIDEIECQISPKYIPGAINWADETMDNAWSNAISRFERALIESKNRHPEWLRSEAELYKITILDLLRKYKAHKSLGAKTSLLEAIKDQLQLGIKP